MRASDAQSILDAFGYLQHGLVTSAQAAASGVDSTTMTRLCQRDVIRRVRRGVYILAGVAEDSLTEIRAAWLATSPGVLAEERFGEASPIVVSHASAASILDLGDITPATHTFSSPVRKQSSAADVRHRVAALPAEDITVVEGIPVTTALRTAVDLAKDHLDGDQLHHIIASAIHDHRIKASHASHRIAPYAGDYGYGSGEELVAESLRRFPEDESVTEAARFSTLSQMLQGVTPSPLAPWLENYPNITGLSPLSLGASVLPDLSSPIWKNLRQQNLDLSSQIAGALGSDLSSILRNLFFSSAFDELRALGMGGAAAAGPGDRNDENDDEHKDQDDNEDD